MLYQVIELTYPAPHNQFTLPPGVLGAIAFTVAPGGVTRLNMNQLITDTQHMPQDMSMRGWISDQQGGNPFPTFTSQWNITALQNRVAFVYDTLAGLGPFEDGIPLDVAPGAYWLNVLNLVNESNSFFLEISTGA